MEPAIRPTVPTEFEYRSATLEVPIQVARHALLQATGAALFAPSVIAHELRSGTLTTLDVTDLPELYCESAVVVYGSAAHLSAVARALLEAIAEQADDLCIRSVLPGRLASA